MGVYEYNVGACSVVYNACEGGSLHAGRVGGGACLHLQRHFYLYS